MGGYKTKEIRIPYGIRGNPHEAHIKKAKAKWKRKGYHLVKELTGDKVTILKFVKMPKGVPFLMWTEDNSGFVYLIEGGGLYKIGMTSGDVHSRLANLQTASPHPLSLVHVIETDNPKRLEKELHTKFKEKRVQREWFRLTNRDVKWIKKRK